MKKTLLIGALSMAMLALTASNASAEVKLSGVGLKLHGSLASATYDQENLNDLVDSKIGYGGGFQLLLELHSLFAIQPELLYINKGHSFKSNILGNTVDSTVSLNYVQLPVFAVIQLPIIPAVTPKLMVGPHFAYHLFGSQTLDSTTSDGRNTSTTEDINKDDISSVDFGISAAVGVDIQLEAYKLTLDLRWEKGLLGVNNRAEDDENWTHTATSVNVGIMF